MRGKLMGRNKEKIGRGLSLENPGNGKREPGEQRSFNRHVPGVGPGETIALGAKAVNLNHLRSGINNPVFSDAVAGIRFQLNATIAPFG